MDLILPIFRELNSADARYVVVGGFAVVLHGVMRFTADLDLIVALDKPNAETVIKCLLKLDFVPRVPVEALDFADQSCRESWIKEKGLTVFSMYKKDNPLLGVDLFVENPLPFEELYKDAVDIELGDTIVKVCSREHLIQMKRMAARAKDLEDIRLLNILYKT